MQDGDKQQVGIVNNMYGQATAWILLNPWMSRVYPLVLTQSYQLMVRKCYSSILTERLALSETYVYTKEDL
jgi:hypothetical protein